MIRSTAVGVEIDIRVIPRAHTTQLAGVRNDRVLVRLSAPPVEGAANAALVAFLAEVLSVPSRRVRVISGARSREKRVAVDGVTKSEAEHLLGA
jgi:uncharacterized protein